VRKIRDKVKDGVKVPAIKHRSILDPYRDLIIEYLNEEGLTGVLIHKSVNDNEKINIIANIIFNNSVKLSFIIFFYYIFPLFLRQFKKITWFKGLILLCYRLLPTCCILKMDKVARWILGNCKKYTSSCNTQRGLIDRTHHNCYKDLTYT